jgi:hypothetical protein
MAESQQIVVITLGVDKWLKFKMNKIKPQPKL